MTAASQNGARRRRRVLMLLENNPYPDDVRVRLEALSLVAGGYDVTVVAPRGDGERPQETVDGVHVRRFPLPEFGAGARGIATEYLVANLQLYARGLLGLLRGADIVHLHNPPDTFFGVAWIARLLGRRVVFDLHDIAPELFDAKFGPGRIVRVLERLERISAQSADRVLTVNESLRGMVAERDGVPVDRVHVVRNAPPASMLADVQPARAGVLADPRLVFVGSIESQDGVDELPELVRRLRDRGLDGVTMTVVGNGGRRAHVEELSRRLGVADRMTFTGRVPHDQVVDHLAHADVCVEPAPVNELNDRCSMVKVYEYMAAGRPIVAFPLREVRWLGREHIQYAAPGDLDSFVEHLRRLAGDGDERLALGARLRERAAALTWERSAEELLRAYDALET